MKGIGSWLALVALLTATLVGALTFDRSGWPSLVGDEATYLMQAQSLAWDHDLAYTRADYDRFLAQWGRKPEGLILQSDDIGRTLRYGKPPAYAVYLAPFLRLAPQRGVPIANALLLALTAIVAARALRRSLGPASPLWVAVWLFGSVAFATFGWAHPDLFLMDLGAIALALVYGIPGAERAMDGEGAKKIGATREEAPSGLGAIALRAGVAGALLGLAAASRPFYAALGLPLVFAFPRGTRRVGIGALALGAALVMVPGFRNLAEGEAWSPEYGGQRQSFDSSTGFPLVDMAGGAEGSWTRSIATRGNHSWKPEQVTFEKRQSAWNAFYFFTGRHVGILPYFLPLILGFAAFTPRRGRWLLPWAVLLASACILYIRPYNFYGGGGAIANRYFLPLYPGFWFMAGRRPRGEVWKPLLAALLAAPFLLPLWHHPRAFLLDAEGGYAYVSASAQRWLPYETTLSHLKPAGQDDFVHGALWVKPLTTSLKAEEGGARIRLGPGGVLPGAGQLLLGSPHPIAGVEVETLLPAARPLIVAGGGDADSGSSRGLVQAIRFTKPRAVHRTWWTDAPYYFYRLDLRLPQDGFDPASGVSFVLRPLQP